MSLLRLRRALPLAACVVVLLTGCGAAGQANPVKMGPSGVDELVIPTPDPDPEDFVTRIDNPWLPLVPGTVWTYDATGDGGSRLEVRVEQDTEEVDGVECVAVHSVVLDPSIQATGVTRFYAQDSAGNVWLFGERPDVPGTEGVRDWMAGEQGAQAGIAMLAKPRVGDGYVHERAGDVQDRSTVLALDGERTVPAGTFGDLVVTEDTISGGPDVVVHRYYAEGVGLVEETRTGGPGRLALSGVSPALS